ncbi:Dystrophin-related protein 2 [Armadillidium vulgare]|nr:Dystrophin-related protein 2 [Armadillidium vulgare]
MYLFVYVQKFRETLPDLQRVVAICCTWKNLETTVNDRWRQVAGRSREVTPLTPAQLASSVSPPWERATATNKVPYYINIVCSIV